METMKEVNNRIRKMSYQDQLREINKYFDEAAEAEKVDKKFGYITTNLKKLTEMILECDQFDLETDESVFTTRVFRSNRYIPNYILDLFHCNRTVIGGMFIELPCWILPKEMVEKASKNKYKAVMNPEEYGLPPFSKCMYGTIKCLGGCYIALAKLEGFDIVGNWIYTSSHIEYMYVK